jgi:type VI secretion system protein ImpC
LENLRSIGGLFELPEAFQWNRLRESEDSRYVGLTLPRILLRLPYGKDTVAIEEFGFEELTDPSNPSYFLWGSSAFALATRVTSAFALYGWCAAIRGVESGGLVEGLPVFTFRTDGGDVALKCPTEIAITDRREMELSKLGFIPLVHARNTDWAAFFSVNSLQKPHLYQTDEAAANARLAATLPYVFAVSRFAHFIRAMMRDKIGSFISRADVEVFLNTWIKHYVATDDSASMEQKAKFPLREALIEVEENPSTPGAYRVVAYLRPHFQLDELTASLRLVISLPSTARIS